MRKTHFELLTSILDCNLLFERFEAVKVMDLDINEPINEGIIDSVFPPEVCSKIVGNPFAERISREQRKMDMSVFSHTYHLWRDQNYFDITPELIERLMDTDLKDIDTFFLRTPYRSMYISLPLGNNLYIPNDISGKHEITGLYISFNDYDNPQNFLLPYHNKTIKGVTKVMHALVCGKAKLFEGDAVIYYDLLFKEGKVTESLEINKDILNSKIWSSVVETFQLILKIILYINCSNNTIRDEAGFNLEAKLAGLKNPTKKRKAAKRFGDLSSKAHKVLDISIKDRNDSYNSVGTHRTSSIISTPVKVRGHFKGQRFGENLCNSKTIWIKPYIRGEGAEAYKDKKRTYHVT